MIKIERFEFKFSILLFRKMSKLITLIENKNKSPTFKTEDLSKLTSHKHTRGMQSEGLT